MELAASYASHERQEWLLANAYMFAYGAQLSARFKTADYKTEGKMAIHFLEAALLESGTTR